MNLLTNAIEAIQVGVADYKDGSRPRLLASVRNVYAGLLLLYKEALRRKSPPESKEVLIKAQTKFQRDSSGKVVAVGTGRKTVNVHQIRERFSALGITTDWQKLEKISSVRNDVAHYYPTINATTLNGVIANAFVLLRDFIDRELRQDPRSLLGETTWDEMLQIAEVYQAERKACEKAIELIDWNSPVLSEAVKNLYCAECGTDLLIATPVNSPRDEVSLKCRACGNEENAEKLIPRAIEEELSWDMYLSLTDGNELPYVSCPECSREAYIISEEKCANCDHEATHICIRCGENIPPEELDSEPYCSWCAHMKNKND